MLGLKPLRTEGVLTLHLVWFAISIVVTRIGGSDAVLLRSAGMGVCREHHIPGGLADRESVFRGHGDRDLCPGHTPDPSVRSAAGACLRLV